MKYILLLGLFFVGCTTTTRDLQLSDKDGWIAIRSLGGDSIYYCEKQMINNKVFPTCKPVTNISSKEMLDEIYRKPVQK